MIKLAHILTTIELFSIEINRIGFVSTIRSLNDIVQYVLHHHFLARFVHLMQSEANNTRSSNDIFPLAKRDNKSEI